MKFPIYQRHGVLIHPVTLARTYRYGSNLCTYHLAFPTRFDAIAVCLSFPVPCFIFVAVGGVELSHQPRRRGPRAGAITGR